jgi:hypothetical protein
MLSPWTFRPTKFWKLNLWTFFAMFFYNFRGKNVQERKAQKRNASAPACLWNRKAPCDQCKKEQFAIQSGYRLCTSIGECLVPAEVHFFVFPGTCFLMSAHQWSSCHFPEKFITLIRDITRVSQQIWTFVQKIVSKTVKFHKDVENMLKFVKSVMRFRPTKPMFLFIRVSWYLTFFVFSANIKWRSVQFY